MNNKIKTTLFASLLVAMILPFSVMSMADASPNENANDKAKQNDYNKKNKIAKEKNDRSLREEPEAALYSEIKDKTVKEKHLIKEERKNKPKPPHPTIGTGHISFGTLLDESISQITGVYSKNEVHDSGISLKDNTFLYAPVTLAPNYSGWEVTTMYEGTSSGTDKYVVLFNHVTKEYNWNNEHVIDSNFINTYTLTQNSSDYYYTQIIKYGSGWYVYLYNFDTAGWELWDVVSGNGNISDGWVAWEEYHFDNDNCPTTLPEIEGERIKVKHDGSWKYATSSYANEYDDGSICGITDATFSSNYYEWSVDD